MKYEIREAALGDFDATLGLYRQLHATDAAVPCDLVRGVFEAIRETPHLYLLVLDVEGEALATAYLNVIPNMTRAASPYAVIENVVVDERYRGKGHGKRIMRGALDLAWAKGCYKVTLMTGSRREATHAFYRACGFSDSEKVGYVARPAPN